MRVAQQGNNCNRKVCGVKGRGEDSNSMDEFHLADRVARDIDHSRGTESQELLQEVRRASGTWRIDNDSRQQGINVKAVEHLFRLR